jgi:hypothetical protein
MKIKKNIIWQMIFLSCFFFSKDVVAMDLESPPSLPVRQSARLIILDAEDRLLLMQIKPDKPADPISPSTTLRSVQVFR